MSEILVIGHSRLGHVAANEPVEKAFLARRAAA